MNTTQIQTTFAPIIAAIAGFLAGKGYFGWDAQTWIAILGGLGALGATIWGAVATTKTAMVNTVAGMSEVKSVTLEASDPAAAAMNAATPSNVKVG